ncbi:GntR family transcriptional regulator [Variovorax sp. PCZ-1]|uniref:GntR family transcriptional regulator n=1 Tax=Variovorax sp. PCZ-1 TaxID=2835533 RepID=UPI001BCC1AA7|nr:GntR family transcriptional regulator [Variovorax sp. PCZ-1]MBS7806527.1 GntR family transcriptional regulator [Variovorax sp. PCZ-1]
MTDFASSPSRKKAPRFNARLDTPDVTQLLKPIADSGAGAVPLYRQVKSALLRLLESGQLGPGETLPNEAQIAKALQVSIGTLRKAVDELVHEHILVRRQGKGTFVAMHGQERFMFQFFHVEPRPDVFDQRVVTEREFPVVDNLGFAAGRATDSEAYALRLRVGDEVLRVDNSLSLGGQCVVHDRIVVSAAMFKGLNAKRFQERPSTIYNLYQTDHGISVIRAQERARAVAASSEVAKVLGVRVGAPVMEVHRVAITFGERPVELRISTINTQAHDYVSLINRRS